MDRREFVRAAMAGSIAVASRARWLAGSGLAATFAAGSAQAQEPDEASLRVLTGAADAQAEKTLGEYAGQLEGSPRGLTRQVRRLVTPFVWSQSSHHHDDTLLTATEEMLGVLETRQHADGTFSVGNRHSPPDTGFLIEDMGLMSSILRADNHAASAGIADRVEAMMAKAGPPLATGGVHTPNHRWKLCAALARIGHVTGDDSYVQRIDEWFAEGIDVDAEGIYSERSPTYAAEVTNPSLLVVAHVLGRPELIDIVRKNLETSIEHAEPGGDIEAIQSRRQDQDHRRKLIRDFYVQYRELALLDGNGRFASIVRGIEQRHSGEIGDFLGDLVERPELAAMLPAEEEPFQELTRLYPSAGLVRLRRGPISASIFGGSDWYANGERTPHYNRIGSGLSTNPTMLRVWKGAALLEAVRLIPNFFSMGHFRSNGISEADGGWLLQNLLEIPYYLPMPPEKRNPDGVYALQRSIDGRFYSALSFEERPTQMRTLGTRVLVSEAEDGFDLAFDVSGEEDVEMTLELTFREGGTVSGAEPREEEGTFHLVDGIGRYETGTDTITFGPGNGMGVVESGSGEQYTVPNGRLIVPGPRVYITGKTPWTYTLALRFL